MDEPTGRTRSDAGDSLRVGPKSVDRTTLELAEKLCRRFQLANGLIAFKKARLATLIASQPA